MINTWDGGRQKSKVADEIVLKIMDSVYKLNRDVEFSLRVFGHQSTVDENNCHDTRNEVAFSKDNRLQMEYRLDDIQPLGVTSIAYALQEAADNDLVDVLHNAYSIILITDGGESCGGDICAVMRKLAINKVFFRPYIVNLESSAQLKTAYACMGDYLEVTRQGDIPGAVSKIVNAFRPIITITNKEYTQIKEVAATAPTVLNVTIPVIKMKDTVVTAEPPKGPIAVAALTPAAARMPVSAPTFPKLKLVSPAPLEPVVRDEAPEAPEKLPTIAIERARSVALKELPITITLRALKQVPVAPFAPVQVEEAPVRPAPESIGRTTIVQPRSFATIIAAAPTPRTVAGMGRFEPVIVEEIPPRPAPETITRLSTPPKRLINLFVLDGDGSILRPRKVPPMPALKYDEPPAKPVVTKPTEVGKPLPGKEAEFKVETEEAEQTTVQVYFTNGHGKFYTTTPQVVLLDPVTGNMVKRFYRMVDGDGNPDPQLNIPPGHYNLTFSETRSVVVNNVVVEANKKNKIVITVNKASLSFEYAGDRGRPVKEFAAIVTQRNRPNGTVTSQKCTERLEYEPENYHVEINTFPQDIRNLDLDFDEKVITIPQPGFAKFVADESMTSVTLYEQLGDKFRSFSTLKLSDPALQHLRIQPGKYEAHYHKGPGGSFASEKVVTFLIKAKEETVVELK